MTTNDYLFVMWDGGGTVPPELSIARRLVERGHRVTVLSEATVREEARRAGCTFVEYQHGFSRTSRRAEDDPIKDFDKKTPIGALAGTRDVLICGLASEFSRDVRETAADGDFDAIIVDVFLLGALPGAQATGLPIAVLNPGPEMRPAPGRPPAGMGLKPSDGMVARLRDRLLKAFMMKLFSSGAEPVNRARRAAELPPLDHPFDQYDEVDRYLMLTSEHYDFLADEQPDNMVYVGPQLDDPAWADSWVPPGDVDSLVLVTLGSTFQDQKGGFQAAIDAFRGVPAQALVTLGNVYEVDDFDAPDNVDVVHSAPHNQVLPHTDAAVVHGGHGTVMKTLAAGRPMVVVPLGRDQFDNGARVEVAGAGIMVKKPTASNIRKALTEILEDPSYRKSAESLGSKLRQEVEDDRAVDELEKLCTANGGAESAESRLRAVS